MKAKQLFTVTLFWILLASMVPTAWTQTPAGNQALDYKITTHIPHQITTPDRVGTIIRPALFHY